MRTRQWLVAGALALSLNPVYAGLFDDDEARKRITNLEDALTTRLAAVESSNSSARLDLSNQLDTLRQEVAKLRGQLEMVNNELEVISKRQKDFYIDLDNRVRKLEAGATVDAKQAPSDPVAEGQEFEAALNLYKASRSREASESFRNFINRYPNSNYLPRAHFWLASALLQQKDLGSAVDHFGRVSTQWPDDTRAPDALLNLADCQQLMGDAKQARKTLETLVAKYPNAPATKTAKQRLATK
jgi:tol-pal system protein YbgF